MSLWCVMMTQKCDKDRQPTSLLDVSSARAKPSDNCEQGPNCDRANLHRAGGSPLLTWLQVQVHHLDCRYRYTWYLVHLVSGTPPPAAEYLFKPVSYFLRSMWGRLIKVDSWVPSLFLASASVVLGRLEANFKLDQVGSDGEDGEESVGQDDEGRMHDDKYFDGLQIHVAI